jgi:hypothetical protein
MGYGPMTDTYSRPSARIDMAANVAVILTCVLVCYAIVARLAARPTNGPLVPYKVGVRMETSPAIHYSKAAWTAVLFVKSTCPYCTQSMGLYREIAALSAHQTGRLRLVVASPESVDISARYLADNRVGVDRVLQVGTTVPTPTLVLADNQGIVRALWVGRQDEAGSRAVIRRLSVE